MTVATRPLTNGKRPQPRPTTVTLDRHSIVGSVMDWQALASGAMTANGAALSILARLPHDPAVYEAMRATHDTHACLMRLLRDLRVAAGELDNHHT